MRYHGIMFYFFCCFFFHRHPSSPAKKKRRQQTMHTDNPGTTFQIQKSKEVLLRFCGASFRNWFLLEGFSPRFVHAFDIVSTAEIISVRIKNDKSTIELRTNFPLCSVIMNEITTIPCTTRANNSVARARERKKNKQQQHEECKYENDLTTTTIYRIFTIIRRRHFCCFLKRFLSSSLCAFCSLDAIWKSAIWMFPFFSTFWQINVCLSVWVVCFL